MGDPAVKRCFALVYQTARSDIGWGAFEPALVPAKTEAPACAGGATDAARSAAPTPSAEFLMKARLELILVGFIDWLFMPDHSLPLPKKTPCNWPPWLWQTS
jgi:hypothetical protein